MKKRKFLFAALVLSLVTLAALISGCGKNDDKTFTVGFDAEFPPYGYMDESGEYIGVDLDLAAEVCERNGWELVKRPIDWNSKDMELESGTIDCIWNGFTLNGREDDYTWSVPYVDNSQVVVVLEDSPIKELSDLEGKVVAVQSDSSALAAFEGDDATDENKALRAKFKEFIQIGDYNTAFMNLQTGAVEAVCLDIGVASYQVQSREGLRMLDAQVSTEQYAVGFKKGNTELRDKVQATLDEMIEDGTFDEIMEDWSLSNVAYKENKSKSGKIKFMLTQLSKGMLSTISIFVLTLLFALPLGLLLAFVRMSKSKILQWIAKIYISIMRGTPLMLQLLVVFFGPSILFGVTTTSSYRFYAVIIGFSLNYAAYFAEIYRSGIEGIPKGQREAAAVLGYSNGQTFRRIIFPQMVKRILPPVTNEVITLVKDTSLAFAIAYTEMFTIAKQIVANQSSIIPLFVAGIFYYIFNFIVAMIMEQLEKKMQYYS